MHRKETQTIAGKIKDKLKTQIAAVPRNRIARVGGWLGYLAYFTDARHRRIVRRNLRFAYPHWPQGQVRLHSAEIFRNMGITALEICQMVCMSRANILSSVHVEGRENLEKVLGHPHGAIIVSAHLGNWEMAHMFAACYIDQPLSLVARVQSKSINGWMQGFRTRLGSKIIDKKGALPEMGKTLKKGHLLCLLMDQVTLRSKGVEVLFFQKTTNATPAAALLALRYRSLVLPAFCVRKPEKGLVLVVKPPLQLIRSGDLRKDIQANTQRLTEIIETAVRDYSDQWFWFHKRWKRHFPELYTEDIKRLKRRRERQKKRHDLMS
jgi:KDO2-lipid IV(A) lauroyltransferase